MRIVKALAAALAALASSLPARAAPPLVLTHANVIDGISDQPLRDVTIIVRDGRIVSIGRAPGEIPADARQIDLAGRWVMPGLVDAHVHPGTLAEGRNILRAGITTGRSMLTFHYADVGLNALHRRGVADLPEILPAGYPIVPDPSSFTPDLGGIFLDTPDLADLMGRPLDEDGVRRLVRANLAHGATVIKVFATDRAGVLSSDPRRRLLTEAQMAAAVAEARAGGAQVAAHAHGDEGAAAAVRAGVNTIDHGAFLSAATLRLMRERGVCFVPTMAVIADGANGSDGPDAGHTIRARALAPRSREAVRTALALGVTVVAGTDSLYGATSSLTIADEMAALASVGMAPMDVLRAATSRSAACIGVGDRTGSLRPGYEADMIVLERNPLEELAAVRDARIIINDGVVAIERPDY